MIYVGIDVAKKKFYYCIIDIELKIIKRGIIINNIQISKNNKELWKHTNRKGI